MAERGMEVDTEHLNAGADRCGDAAGTALAAAGELAEMKPAAGMFGDFDEARMFHQAVSAAHQGHVEQFQAHHRALGDISAKSRSGADEFTATDASSADSVRAAGARFGAP
ncbi:DUF2563 family protein [Mycolicibacterium fluoranthenivorans]|uniref:DUF2563 family protein n=1 Tax=Mycolicibacterium fluoranthenivorans TaxID=258505 RepID=A0A7X5ZB63_9MYCO|nr:DUF2563 family protein [Mycolicibacterium fluoranthenivorans]MCV7356626.1 DUF2563 family protein [Mycolicibacterium fluoranthenivorans]NIH94018.1 hypothetical protein [Mycolicibacterium fluoranthenivorans]